MRTIVTDRMILVPGTGDILEAQQDNPDRLALLLGAQIPYNWPPEMFETAVPFFVRQLAQNPSWLGWLVWYWLKREPLPEQPTLVGNGGFKGGPDSSGTVELGYSILKQYERHGYATEGSRALIGWAFEHPEVRRVIAHVYPDNLPSVRVLQKLNFMPTGDGAEDGTKLWELNRPSS